MAGSFCMYPLSRPYIQGNTEAETADNRDLTTDIQQPPREFAWGPWIEILRVLDLAEKLIPVPYLKDVINLAQNVLLACEETTRVENRARELKDRVGSLMIAIIDNVTFVHDDIKSITNSADMIKGDIQSVMKQVVYRSMFVNTRTLPSVLGNVMNNLDKIIGQNRCLRLFFRRVNKSNIDDCLNRLESSLERFNVAHIIRSSKALQNIQLRLEKIQGLTQHVADQVQHLHDRFDGFETTLSALNDANAHRDPGPTSPTLLKKRMPLKPRIFHGRNDLVEEIAHLLCNESSSQVCILGPGGMGKTSLALTTVESPIVRAKYGQRCFWVPCIEAASPHLLLEILSAHLEIGRNTGDALADILSELNSSREPRLILLDNFETPWFQGDGTRRDVGDILRRISQPAHVAILMTMRGGNPPCDDIIWQPKHLEAVDEESSRFIFHEIYPKSKGDPGVGSLLAALGHMPFAVILMAKLGQGTKSSAKDLLADWLQSGTNLISDSDSIEDDMNRSIGLSVDRSFVQKDRRTLLLLETLSLLPAGTSKANLRWWAQDLESRLPAIKTLSDAALLLVGGGGHSTETTLFVLPVVQSFMSSTNRISNTTHQAVQKACCKYVLDHSGRYYEADFNRKSKALEAEDTNIQSILLPLVVSESVIKVLLHFTWYRFDTRPSIEIARRTLDLAKSLGNDRYIAEALCALGGTYFRLSKDDLAMHSLSEVYQLSDKLIDRPGAPRLTAEWIALLTDARTDCEMPVDSTLSLIYHVQPKFPEDFDRAYVFKALGLCFLRNCQYLEAIDVLDQAKVIFKRLKNPIDAAHSLIRIARSYRGLAQFSQALEAIEEASSVIEEANHPRMRAETECQHARVLLALGRYAEARSKFESCLQSFQRLGSLITTGEILENIGDTHSRNDYQSASMAYEAAAKKYLEVGPKSPISQKGIERCEQKIEAIRMKEQNPEADISLPINQIF